MKTYTTEIDGVTYKFKALTIDDIVKLGMQGECDTNEIVDAICRISLKPKPKSLDNIPELHRIRLVEAIQNETFKELTDKGFEIIPAEDVDENINKEEIPVKDEKLGYIV
jgi:hypothetical protein